MRAGGHVSGSCVTAMRRSIKLTLMSETPSIAPSFLCTRVTSDWQHMPATSICVTFIAGRRSRSRAGCMCALGILSVPTGASALHCFDQPWNVEPRGTVTLGADMVCERGEGAVGASGTAAAGCSVLCWLLVLHAVALRCVHGLRRQRRHARQHGRGRGSRRGRGRGRGQRTSRRDAAQPFRKSTMRKSERLKRLGGGGVGRHAEALPEHVSGLRNAE